MAEKHHKPKNVSDKIALGFTKAFALLQTRFSKKDMGIEQLFWKP